MTDAMTLATLLPLLGTLIVAGAVIGLLAGLFGIGGGAISVPVFYEIGHLHLHRYADFGLTFVKLGEEARVDLSLFTLEGSRGARYRQAVRRLEKDGGLFRVVEPAGLPAIMPRLRAVSDDWLSARSSAEKGFSLGFFDEAYLSRFLRATGQ